MLSLDEFKKRYSSQIDELDMTEKEILESYKVYLEDPHEFHENMLG
jgi:hypothetical protein